MSVPPAAVTTAILTVCSSSVTIAAMRGATIATAPPVKIRMMKVRQRTVCRTFFLFVLLQLSLGETIFVSIKVKIFKTFVLIRVTETTIFHNSQTEQMVLSYPVKTIFSIWVRGAWRCPVGN